MNRSIVSTVPCTPLMKRLLIPLLLVLLSASEGRPETIWSEDFEGYAVGTGIDGNGESGDYPGSVTSWTLETNAAALAASDDYIKTVDLAGNRCLEAQDVNGDAVWTTEAIDIAAYTNVQFALAGAERGDHEPEDYIDIAYQLDGGAWTLIQDWDGGGSSTHTWLAGADGSEDAGDSFIAVVQAVTGNELKMRVTMLNNAGDEQLQIDDIVVSGTPAVAPPASLTISQNHAAGFLLEWEVVAEGTNYAVDVATDPAFPAYPGNLVQINEIHADATGDVEFVELVAPASTELAGYRIVHYNGAGGAVIWDYQITAFTVPDDGIVDTAGRALGFFVLGETGVTARDATTPGSLQNGDDAVVLYDAAGTLLDAVAWASPYSGALPPATSTNGLTAWHTSLHTVPDDSYTQSAQAPNRPRDDTGAGWTIAPPTAGSINTGQTSGTICLQPGTAPILPNYASRLCGAAGSLTVSNLVSCTTYYVRLRTWAPGGCSGNSATQTGTTTPLSPGAIAIVAYNMDNPDRFTFIILTNLAARTAITFSDNPWNGSELGTTENTGQWQATEEMVYGTLVTITDGIASVGRWSGDALQLNGSDGDAVLAYQVAESAPHFLTALNIGPWMTAPSGEEQLPASLTLGVNAIEIDPTGTPDNGFYAAGFEMEPELLPAAIHNRTNWLIHSRTRLWPGEIEEVPPPAPSCFMFK
jgi:hypothetical protein